MGAEEIRRKILADVTSGVLPVGTQLPPEREFAEHLGVSRNTLRHALDELAMAGVLRRERGRSGGTFVTHPKLERDLNPIDGLPALLQRQGFTTGTRVLSTRLVTADPGAQLALNVSGSALLVNIVRLRLADGRPISLDNASFPVERFPDLLEHSLGGSLYELLEKQYGVRAAQAQEELEIVAATEEEAELLGIAASAPLMSISRTTLDESGQPFEYSHDLFRGDRTRIRVCSTGTGVRATTRSEGKVIELRPAGT